MGERRIRANPTALHRRHILRGVVFARRTDRRSPPFCVRHRVGPRDPRLELQPRIPSRSNCRDALKVTKYIKDIVSCLGLLDDGTCQKKSSIILLLRNVFGLCIVLRGGNTRYDTRVLRGNDFERDFHAYLLDGSGYE